MIPFYLVISGRAIDAYTPERDVKDCTWSETVKDIAEGQFENIISVIEIGTGRQVLPMMMLEVEQVWAKNDESLSDWQKELHQHVKEMQAATKLALQAAE